MTTKNQNGNLSNQKFKIETQEKMIQMSREQSHLTKKMVFSKSFPAPSSAEDPPTTAQIEQIGLSPSTVIPWECLQTPTFPELSLNKDLRDPNLPNNKKVLQGVPPPEEMYSRSLFDLNFVSDLLSKRSKRLRTKVPQRKGILLDSNAKKILNNQKKLLCQIEQFKLFYCTQLDQVKNSANFPRFSEVPTLINPIKNNTIYVPSNIRAFKKKNNKYSKIENDFQQISNKNNKNRNNTNININDNNQRSNNYRKRKPYDNQYNRGANTLNSKQNNTNYNQGSSTQNIKREGWDYENNYSQKSIRRNDYPQWEPKRDNSNERNDNRNRNRGRNNNRNRNRGRNSDRNRNRNRNRDRYRNRNYRDEDRDRDRNRTQDHKNW
ncbi:zinc finger ccch domain-containing protein [Anaeramoeba flamelloides]|uniref:Zinc finger ccch domain-containing protein n=1 Tax=Anaeramoeba flamelloides TaxID=1746091 RepID=A0ABQ8XJ59_9EUKA|nr:zinc finger ccch domain-containing protein [Anaeramoeba flamelloides]